jgi:RNA polymerase sigma-70 factor, ECF subfamily
MLAKDGHRKISGLGSVPSDSKELERLLLRMSEKDEAAFEKLYAVTKRKLFSTALLIVKRRHLAEEVVQEAYVRIWLNAASYRPTLASPMSWMITIARNRAIDIARKSAREIYSDESTLACLLSDHTDALDVTGIRDDENDAVNRLTKAFIALQTLDPARRQLVIAAYVHGESRNHLSERLGVPVNTVKTWIRRALLEARASLQARPALAAEPLDSLKISSTIRCLSN